MSTKRIPDDGTAVQISMAWTAFSQARFEATGGLDSPEARALASVGLGSPEAKALADKLQDEIQQYMHLITCPFFITIVERLNSVGHCLGLYEEPVSWDYAFRDTRGNKGPTHGYLRLGMSGTGSAGYGTVIGTDTCAKGKIQRVAQSHEWSMIGPIDSRFSWQAFERRGLDSPAARELADELERTVAWELHRVLWPAFESLVWLLNSMGHELKPYVDVDVGNYEFRDYRETAGDVCCHLRASFEYSVHAGYFL